MHCVAEVTVAPLCRYFAMKATTLENVTYIIYAIRIQDWHTLIQIYHVAAPLFFGAS